MSVDRNSGDGAPSSGESVSNNLGPASGSGGSPPLNAARKPVSARKLAANRANAARSTGPRTREGKARVAMNALRHGLAAHAPLLPGEEPDELEALAAAYQRDLRPRGALEEELVARIVGIAWRLRRVARAEEAMWDQVHEARVDEVKLNAVVREVYKIPELPGMTGPVAPPLPAGRFVAGQFGGDGVSGLERLAMYEQRLARGLHAAIRELNTLRKLRVERDDDVDNDPVAARAGNAPVDTPAVAKAQADFGELSRAASGAASGDDDSAQNKSTEPSAAPPTDSSQVGAAAGTRSDERMDGGDALALALQNKANAFGESPGEPMGGERTAGESGVERNEGGVQ
jgi:hypothetical protein